MGDYTVNAIKFARLDNIAKAYTKLTGKDCGCERRKDLLNLTGNQIINTLFKGSKITCPNEQQRAMIAEMEVYNRSDTKLQAIRSQYTAAQITGLYRAITGLVASVPTCKCQSTIDTLATWINRMKEICNICED